MDTKNTMKMKKNRLRAFVFFAHFVFFVLKAFIFHSNFRSAVPFAFR